MARYGLRRLLAEEHIIYAIVVIVVLVVATIYALVTGDHSGNIWIVYGTGLGFAGRSAVRPAGSPRSRRTDGGF
jgi:hypothetical protein